MLTYRHREVTQRRERATPSASVPTCARPTAPASPGPWRPTRGCDVKAGPAVRSRLRATAVATLLATCAGCGVAPAAGGAPPAAPAPARTATAFCDSVVNLDMAAGSGAADIASALPAEVPAAVDSYSNVLRTLLPAVESSAPEQLVPAVSTLERLNLDAATRADPAVYRTAAFLDADRQVDANVLATCGYPEIRISAKEYALQGIPTERRPAGTMAITLANVGGVTHAIAIGRIDGAETRPIAELAKLPPDQLSTVLSPVGSVRVDPTQTATVFLRFPPGRYAVLCPVRVPAPPPSPAPTTRPGSTRTPPPPPPGPPHYTLGEFGEFTIGP